MTDGVEDEDALLDERLERGTSVDRYVVLYELGSGGMGVVYAAYDPQLDRKVALKLLHAHSRSDRARTRLLREAKAIASITHPNVVTVHDVGTYEGRVFVAMEYVEGLTLRRWLQEQRRPWQETLAVLRLAGEGLAAAHAGDLIHRDFKPDNVLVDEHGRAVVLDFGLARRASSQDDLPPVSDDGSVSARGMSSEVDLDLTRTGAKLGTPAYMAPEQHLSSPTDARTDQFSFCVVTWEALYGSRPFAGATTREARYSVLKGELQEPHDTDVPVAMRRALTRGLSLDPDDRYTDMPSLLAALDRVEGRKLPRWGLLAGVAATASAAALGGWYAQGGREGEQCSVERWDGVWDDGVRDRVEVAFAGSGAKFSSAAWGTVEVSLDRYASAWTNAHRDACEATHVHHEQSLATLELRMACLRSHQQAAAALVHEFADADASVVENAVEAVNALPRIAECGDLARLRDGALGGRGQPSNAGDTVPLREALVDARAKESSARYAQAQAIVLGVLGDAQAVGADDVVAEARMRMGSILQRRGEFAQAERSYLEAIWAAQRAGHRFLEAEAWVRLVWVTGVERFDPKRGQLWAEFARAALSRAGGGAVLEAQLRHNLGGVLYRQGLHEEALGEYRAALSQQIELLGEDDPRVATTLNHIGNALMELRRYEESEASCRRSLEIRQRLFGEQHPTVAASLNNLGELARKQGRHMEALEHAVASLDIVGRSGGREEDIASMIAGWSLLELERPGEALPRFERALVMRTESDGPFAPRVVDAEFALARARIALGDRDVALAQLDRVIELESGRRADVVARAREVRLGLVHADTQPATP